MKERCLVVTFRKGRPLAAYLYLPRKSGVTSVRTERVSGGVLIDYGESGDAIGLEMTSPETVTLEVINKALHKLGVEEATEHELRPLAA